ncbi:Protein DEFECTIVE IN MERISTEM SILENCING 3 [Striga hermonthica]|uniref:Protein DEFECTIVE IN MERISTEM SILENCING 3 n=1 Tax=Striga hermonthica TaxID=68872 RepID=A0A9N7MSD9_STRHE|nr:Protein DEFECTIVE IN MERISTEM SILENCING 3 [Striga hermonthica]
MMSGGGDLRRNFMNNDHLSPMSIDSRALVVSDPLALRPVGQKYPFIKEEVHNGVHGQNPASMINHSQKLQDDLQELGQRIKHHEDNIKCLKTLKNKLDDSILDMQVALGKHHTAKFPRGENEGPVPMESEEDILQQILKYENSAAALLCKMKYNREAQVSDHSLTEDVIGVVAILGKVDDANLSRLLSEYLGLETMLAVVCKTYEGVKALEGYTKDGSINKSSGIHALAALAGRPLDDRFLIICLENLRPYTGQIITDDPQRRLDLLKPRSTSGETPAGFLGFAVNMVTIDGTYLYCTPKNKHSLRETLFYNLFLDLQVYRSRDDMLKARPYIAHGAISLDGGIIKSPGMFFLGHHNRDIDVKFASDSKRSLPATYFEIENKLKETKWKKERAGEDMQRELALLDHTKLNYEIKKKEFVQYIAESGSYAAQFQAGRVSTPR